ncbi:MAG: alpha/beta fold hydrolase, partial [Myxococcota bacterium]
MTGPSPDTRPGVSAATVTTARLRTRVLSAASPVDSADPPADPLAADRLAGRRAVLFLHGNLSSATWWEDVLLTLPAGFYGIAPDQRGFGGADPRALIDATRGLGDLADDAIALLDHLGVERAHLVGHS